MAGDFRFVCPFSMLVSGPSNCGKSTFVREVITRQDELYTKPPGRVFYFYRVYQAAFKSLHPYVTQFVQGICSMEWLEAHADKDGNDTIVMDDLALHVTENTAQLFSVGSHHFNVNLIFVCQNLFTKNIYFREISLNSTYILIFKNPRDASTISHFSKQFRPGSSKTVLAMFKDATKYPFSYLLFDMHQNTPENWRIKSNIFAHNQETMKIYEEL